MPVVYYTVNIHNAIPHKKNYETYYRSKRVQLSNIFLIILNNFELSNIKKRVCQSFFHSFFHSFKFSSTELHNASIKQFSILVYIWVYIISVLVYPGLYRLSLAISGYLGFTRVILGYLRQSRAISGYLVLSRAIPGYLGLSKAILGFL